MSQVVARGNLSEAAHDATLRWGENASVARIARAAALAQTTDVQHLGGVLDDVTAAPLEFWKIVEEIAPNIGPARTGRQQAW